VIAGTARGTKLKTAKGLLVRPTADRVKEALFNIIGARIIGATFIDLYAGSGAIGIEALSRGAQSCIFVEREKSNIALIKDNLVKTRLSENARIINASVERTVANLALEKVKAELVYLDPPYDLTNVSQIADSIIKAEIINDGGMLIVEHAYSNRQWAENFKAFRQKKYGDTGLTFITVGENISVR
jgi:16S rRNA (guanine(966)-N(2))-methyltransferase RsmD